MQDNVVSFWQYKMRRARMKRRLERAREIHKFTIQAAVVMDQPVTDYQSAALLRLLERQARMN